MHRTSFRVRLARTAGACAALVALAAAFLARTLARTLARKAPAREPARPSRLHLIDIENLVGGQVRRGTMAQAWQEYAQAVPVDPGHRVVVGVAERHARAAASVLPAHVELAVGDNAPDGADRALLGCVDPRQPYQEVHIASCDHAFAPLAEELAAGGARVVQVIGVGVSSAALYLACPHQVYLPTRIAEHKRHAPVDAPRPRAEEDAAKPRARTAA